MALYPYTLRAAVTERRGSKCALSTYNVHAVHRRICRRAPAAVAPTLKPGPGQPPVGPAKTRLQHVITAVALNVVHVAAGRPGVSPP